MCVVAEPSKNTTYFENVCPILRVQNLEASLRYYVDVLGFKVNWNAGQMASVGRGRCGIMLCEGEQGNPGTWVWVGVGDADLLFEEYRAKGAKIRHPPNNYDWAYEMQVFDLDGNVLRFGSDTKRGEQMGTWVHIKGLEWTQADAKWVRLEHSKVN